MNRRFIDIHVPTLEERRANLPLRFGQSYWDFLPDLVQTKILKMVHQQLLQAVHDELLTKSRCVDCDKKFLNQFEMKLHKLMTHDHFDYDYYEQDEDDLCDSSDKEDCDSSDEEYCDFFDEEEEEEDWDDDTPCEGWLTDVGAFDY